MTAQEGEGGGGSNRAPEASRRTFLKVGAGVVGGLLVGGAAAYIAKPSSGNAASTQTVTCTVTSTVTSTISGTATQSTTGSSTATSTSSTTTTCTSTAANPQNVLLMLSTSEAAEVAAMVDTLIPEDSNGPGAASAGAIYFIDKQLASEYGNNGDMYMQGPFVPPNLTSSITVDSTDGTPITYSGGSAITMPTAGTQYQYGVLLRDFWRYGLQAFETYCGGAYGGNFEKLSASDRVQALTDLANNKPTSFNSILPSDFFQEVFFMTWCGFLMDPLYGGNQGMVGWDLVAFNGTNQGNFYGEGHTTKELMVAATPTRLKPASLAQFQQATTSGASCTSTSSSSSASGPPSTSTTAASSSASSTSS